MNKRLLSILLAGLVLALFSNAFAKDWHVRVNAPLVTAITDELPLAGLGDGLYQAQEGAHGAITALTGVKIDHFYVWVHVGKTSIPVDPLYFSK
ncbi:MAG: hypothetical protein KF813_11545 [Trueperaceae bacterium]|nr:hypothetical protein [Trueperaceae bacterium]